MCATVLLERRQPKDIDVVCVGSGIELAQEVARRTGKPPRTGIPEFRHRRCSMSERSNWNLSGRAANLRPKFAQTGGGGRNSRGRPESPRFYDQRLGLEPQSARITEQLLDPFGGIADLHSRLIRTPLDP